MMERGKKNKQPGEKKMKVFKEACLLIAVVGSLERRWARNERRGEAIRIVVT